MTDSSAAGQLLFLLCNNSLNESMISPERTKQLSAEKTYNRMVSMLLVSDSGRSIPYAYS